LIRLLQDEPLRQRLGAHGAARVRQEFGSERMIDEYEQLLRRFAKQ
jgi:glycosyltransferase involved in cell wall biosynthesis